MTRKRHIVKLPAKTAKAVEEMCIRDRILFLLPLMLLLPLLIGIDGILYAGPVADFAAAGLSLAMVRAELKKMKG